ncbi:PIN domain-like protein, partial [Panaeolus papilionaceus]
TAPHWLIEQLQKLIQAFGFHTYTAPGEAEAELAYLNCTQAIDLVISSDSDVFLFRAQQVA